jgi:hypothetical protein
LFYGYRLRFAFARAWHKSIIGKTTIEVIDLNDRESLVKKRFEVGDKSTKTHTFAMVGFRISKYRKSNQ